MKKLLLGVALALTLTWIGCENMREGAAGEDAGMMSDTLTKEELVKRGEYLVTVAGCHDCHSPKKFSEKGPELDAERLLSGHPADAPLPPIDTSVVKNWYLGHPMLTAWAGPWGVSFSANLTPDESGIGNWSEEIFFKAIREGKHKGLEEGRMILPPMPWQEIAHMTDDDLRSIFTYLKSIKPVKNVVPPPIPPTEL